MVLLFHNNQNKTEVTEDSIKWLYNRKNRLMFMIRPHLLIITIYIRF